jgi:hypothetical protein
LQKFDFNHCKGSLHQHFLKEHLSTITDCNEQVSPPTFMDLVNTILKRINKNRAHYNKGEATINHKKKLSSIYETIKAIL